MINNCFLFHFFLKKNYEEEATKYKRTSMHIEILNHIINSLNRNMSEEVNDKARKISPVAHQFVCNYIFPCTPRKHMNSLCGKIVSWYGLLGTFLKFFLALFLSNYNFL